VAAAARRESVPCETDHVNWHASRRRHRSTARIADGGWSAVVSAERWSEWCIRLGHLTR
jgi:hypothetical protein